MAHETLFTKGHNGFIRSLRAMMLDAPRVVRGNDHDDIANLGVAYELAAAAGARPAGDLLFIAPEVGCPRTTYRATVVVGKGVGGSYQTAIAGVAADFNSGGTIISTDSTNWSTAGVVVGDLIRVSGATTAGNNNVFRVASITTTSTTNDTITVNGLDSLATETGQTITVRPATGGSVFDVREDQSGGNNHIGWMMSEIEFMAKDGTIWLSMDDGGSWAVNDYAEFTLERGAFSLHDSLSVVRTVDLNENGGAADTITRDDYNGSFLRDGFEVGGVVEIIDSAGEDGRYVITAVTARTITLNIGDFTGSEAAVEVTLVPRFTVSSDPVLAISTDDTITRDDGGSWIDDGFVDGGLIEIQDTVSNNGLFLIKGAPTATVLTVDGGEGLVAETLPASITVTPRNSIIQKWTEHRYLGSGVDQVGLLPPVPNADGNYTSEWIGIGPGADPINNPQTVYCGWQAQFPSSALQNVEMRVYDAVSDGAFNSLGNASRPTYMYLSIDPQETYMTGDGEFAAGLAVVGSSVTEWFYQGFGRVHGSQNQHPRPMFNGGMGWQSGGGAAGTGDFYNFFPFGVDKTGTTDPADPKSDSSCWHRWVDGQYFSVAWVHTANGTQVFAPTNAYVEMHTVPYSPLSVNITVPINGGASNLQPVVGTALTNPAKMYTFANALRATPTTVTPNPNREYPLIPITACMINPDFNIVADFKNVFFIPGTDQVTKNRILQGGKVYIVGQNHEKAGQQDFAALLLD